MIVVAVVIGIALAICVAGWVPIVRDALRVDHVLPGPPVREAAQILVELTREAALPVAPTTDPLPETLSA